MDGRHDQHRHGEDLMREPRPERHLQEQGDDAETHLRQRQRGDTHRPPRGAAGRDPDGLDRVGDGCQHHEVGEETVIELHQSEVVDEVLDEGHLVEQHPGRRHEAAVHVGPGVVEEARLRAGDEPAEPDLNQHQHRQQAGEEPHRFRGGGKRPGAGAGGEPDQAGEDQARGGEVERELERRHRRHAGLEARGDHDPADRTLEPAEQAQPEQAEQQAAPEHAADPEPREGQEEQEADDPPEQAVAPFPPVQRLEAVEADALVEDAVLRRVAVLVELHRPVGGAERRDHAGYRPPLGDREARAGEPGRAADGDHRHHEHGEQVEPRAHRAVAGAVGGRRDGVEAVEGRSGRQSHGLARQVRRPGSFGCGLREGGARAQRGL